MGPVRLAENVFLCFTRENFYLTTRRAKPESEA